MSYIAIMFDFDFRLRTDNLVFNRGELAAHIRGN